MQPKVVGYPNLVYGYKILALDDNVLLRFGKNSVEPLPYLPSDPSTGPLPYLPSDPSGPACTVQCRAIALPAQ